VPHAVLQNTNVSTPSTPLSEGSGVGKHTELSVQHQQQQLHQQQLLTIDKNAIIAHNQVVGTELLKISRQEPARVAFVLELTATRDWRWEGILWRSRLYLEVPQRLAQTGSKEGFVALLEFAEEELQCHHVILALGKDRSDRNDVVRTFMFLGFSVLPPGHQLVPANSHNLFLACSLE